MAENLLISWQGTNAKPEAVKSQALRWIEGDGR